MRNASVTVGFAPHMQNGYGTRDTFRVKLYATATFRPLDGNGKEELKNNKQHKAHTFRTKGPSLPLGSYAMLCDAMRCYAMQPKN